MDFKEKEMNLELKEQDSEHNKKKKEEGSPKRKKGCFKRVLSVLVLVVIIGFSFFAGRQSVMTSNAYGTGLNNGKILRKLSMLEAFSANYYLNKIDAENVENNIYKGFAKGLQDPYAEYYTPSEYQQLSEEDAGKYNGIGISIAKDTEVNKLTIRRQTAAKKGQHRAATLPRRSAKRHIPCSPVVKSTSARQLQGPCVTIIPERCGICNGVV